MTRNLAASVRQRLLNLAGEKREDFQLVLTRYGLERLLYRLSRSPHQGRFVLKGALLLRVYTEADYRPTRDLDLLAFGSDDAAELADVFRELCTLEVEDDGLRFDPETVRAAPIREGANYSGVRVQLRATLAGARLPLQIDIGFGDAITPAPHDLEYPTLLDFPAPYVRAYPLPTVVAEKFEAMTVLGFANSRMKDFYDLWLIAQTFSFEGQELARAIMRTFERRGTRLTSNPAAFSQAFVQDRAKQQQWNAFLKRTSLSAPPLPEVVETLRRFLMPPTGATLEQRAFLSTWPSGGPWT